MLFRSLEKLSQALCTLRTLSAVVRLLCCRSTLCILVVDATCFSHHAEKCLKRQSATLVNTLRKNVAFHRRKFENRVGAAHGLSVMSIAFLTPLTAANFHVNRQNLSLATLGAPQHHDCQRRSHHNSNSKRMLSVRLELTTLGYPTSVSHASYRIV